MQRAVSSLYALPGSFDRIGGNRIRRGPVYQGVNARGKISKGLGICIVQLRRKAPYKIRGLMAFGTNPPVSQADIELSREALTKVEFHLHRDLFETPAAQYADIFLPVTTPWEHEGIRFGFEITDEATALVQLRRRMVSPREEVRSDYEIVFDLACRLGIADDFFGGDIQAGWNYMLEPLGLTAATLRAHPEGVKCEIDAREQKH